MKRLVLSVVWVCLLVLLPSVKPAAQIPVLEIIRQAVVKVIKAVDLKIQRLQNRTIWLQNAQKAIENKMQELKLTEIAQWSEKQRQLYQDYYEELWKVKAALSYYQKVKDILQKQALLVKEYKRATDLFRQDSHFTARELEYMANVYTGILEESIKNLDGLYVIINSFATQMSDGQRLELIQRAAEAMDQQLADLRQFTQEGIRLSLRRAKDQREIEHIKALYGLP
jgi:hypothetical protein